MAQVTEYFKKISAAGFKPVFKLILFLSKHLKGQLGPSLVTKKCMSVAFFFIPGQFPPWLWPRWCTILNRLNIFFAGIQTGLGFDSGEQAHFEVDQVQYHHHHNPECMYFDSQSWIVIMIPGDDDYNCDDDYCRWSCHRLFSVLIGNYVPSHLTILSGQGVQCLIITHCICEFSDICLNHTPPRRPLLTISLEKVVAIIIFAYFCIFVLSCRLVVLY